MLDDPAGIATLIRDFLEKGAGSATPDPAAPEQAPTQANAE
jgi:hypothetical protein